MCVCSGGGGVTVWRACVAACKIHRICHLVRISCW
jgi:hypothetical protein